MAFVNFKKEQWTRNLANSWVMDCIAQNSSFCFESIDGYVESRNDITYLFQRARVSQTGEDIALPNVLESIIAFEGEDAMVRKINIAASLGVQLNYVLYCEENEHVWLFEISSISTISLKQTYTSYKSFADWLLHASGNKPVKVKKTSANLPDFDVVLANTGCPWPSSFNGCLFDVDNKLIGIVEFQNADKDTVKAHCSNDYFLCKMRNFITNGAGGYYEYKDDIEHWLTYERVRVKAKIRLFIVVWSRKSSDYVFKEIEKIVFPEIPEAEVKTLKAILHKYSEEKSEQVYDNVCKSFDTYEFALDSGNITPILHHPDLSIELKTFPYIYYKSKEMFISEKENVVPHFVAMLNH